LADSISEPEIYIRCKSILQENGWTLLGGEPPDGTDTIPRIELKDSNNKMKGSKGSKKIDLIATKGSRVLLLELKRLYSKNDVLKLDEIKSEDRWLEALMNALMQKRAFQIAGVQEIPDFITYPELLIKCIGLSKYHEFPDDYALIVVKQGDISAYFGDTCGIDQKLFSG